MCFRKFFLTVHVIKTRPGGPTARVIAGCRAAGPFFWLDSGKYFGFDTISITLDFLFGPSDLIMLLHVPVLKKIN